MNFIENLDILALYGFNIYENRVRQTGFKIRMSLLLTYAQDIHSTRKCRSGFWAFRKPTSIFLKCRPLRRHYGFGFSEICLMTVQIY